MFMIYQDILMKSHVHLKLIFKGNIIFWILLVDFFGRLEKKSYNEHEASLNKDGSIIGLSWIVMEGMR